jgi:hypothetical protein
MLQPSFSHAFSHLVVRTERTIFILSTCLCCKRGQLVSKVDGSLRKWEQSHQCSRTASRAPLPAA